ncbi:MAG: hypothetical protein WB507_10050 [Solirubrobacterales bacterium]
MKEHRKDANNFEERLLQQLRAVVAQRGAEQQVAPVSVSRPPGWRRPSRLAVAAVLVTALALLVFNSGGNDTPNAFAKAFTVQRQGGGGVTIKIYSAEDAAGLERALAKAGIRSQVTWLAAGMRCREPRFTPSTARTSRGGTIGALTLDGTGQAMTIGVMNSQQWRERWLRRTRAEVSKSTPKISLDPQSFRPDQSVVISGSPVPNHGDTKVGYKARFGIAAGPVKPCQPVKGPSSVRPPGSREVKPEPGQHHPKAAAPTNNGSNPSPTGKGPTASEGQGQRSAVPVKRQGGGGGPIRIFSVEDPAPLERALAIAGIRSQVSWLAPGMTCREPRFTKSRAKTSQGGTLSGVLTMSGPGEATTIGAMSHQQWRQHPNYPAGISLDPESFRPDQTVVIFGSRGPYYGKGPEGGFETHIAIAEGPVKPCVPVTVPNGGALGQTNRELEAEAHSSSNVASSPSPTSEAPTNPAGGSQQRSK